MEQDKLVIVGAPPISMELIDKCKEMNIEIVEVEQPNTSLFKPESIPFVMRQLPGIIHTEPRNRAERRRAKYKNI